MKFRTQSGKKISYSDPDWEYKLKLDEYETKLKRAKLNELPLLTENWNKLRAERKWS